MFRTITLEDFPDEELYRELWNNEVITAEIIESAKENFSEGKGICLEKDGMGIV